MTRAAEYVAIKAAIDAQFSDPTAVTYDEAAAAVEDHIIVHISRRYVADQHASGVVTIPGGRLLTKYVVRYSENADTMRERVKAALEDKILPLAGGGEVGPFVFESEAAVGDDEDGWLSGDDVWAF